MLTIQQGVRERPFAEVAGCLRPVPGGRRGRAVQPGETVRGWRYCDLGDFLSRSRGGFVAIKGAKPRLGRPQAPDSREHGRATPPHAPLLIRYRMVTIAAAGSC
jgi:hypothetical protein